MPRQSLKKVFRRRTRPQTSTSSRPDDSNAETPESQSVEPEHPPSAATPDPESVSEPAEPLTSPQSTDSPPAHPDTIFEAESVGEPVGPAEPVYTTARPFYIPGAWPDSFDVDDDNLYNTNSRRNNFVAATSHDEFIIGEQGGMGAREEGGGVVRVGGDQGEENRQGGIDLGVEMVPEPTEDSTSAGVSPMEVDFHAILSESRAGDSSTGNTAYPAAGDLIASLARLDIRHHAEVNEGYLSVSTSSTSLTTNASFWSDGPGDIFYTVSSAGLYAAPTTISQVVTSAADQSNPSAMNVVPDNLMDIELRELQVSGTSKDTIPWAAIYDDEVDMTPIEDLMPVDDDEDASSDEDSDMSDLDLDLDLDMEVDPDYMEIDPISPESTSSLSGVWTDRFAGWAYQELQSATACRAF